RGEGPKRLLELYVSVEYQRSIPEYQFGKLISELKDLYFHYRMLGVDRGYSLEGWEVGYLISNNKNDYLKKYYIEDKLRKNISYENFSKLSDELKEVYLRCRMYGEDHYKGTKKNKGLEEWEVGYLISNNKNDDLKKYFERGYSISYENFNKLSEELKELYIVKRAQSGRTDEWHSKLSSKYKNLYRKSRWKQLKQLVGL
ncbi:MAG: hypothetical protein ACO3UU_13785, partial [Minisyncoccia bacterium]